MIRLCLAVLLLYAFSEIAVAVALWLLSPLAGAIADIHRMARQK